MQNHQHESISTSLYFLVTEILRSKGPIRGLITIKLCYTMHMLYDYIPRVISGILSLAQSTNLRNRVYAMEDRLDILEVAIEDIERINRNSALPNALITNITDSVSKHRDTLGSHYK